MNRMKRTKGRKGRKQVKHYIGSPSTWHSVSVEGGGRCQWVTIRNKPKHQYTKIQSPDWFNFRRPCVLTIHDHIPCRWNGDGQSRQCLSHPCRLSLSEQPVDTLPLTLIPSSLFFFFFFSSREQFVSTLNHFLPPVQTYYSFTPFRPYCVSPVHSLSTFRFFAFSLYSILLSFRLGHTLIHL